MSRWEPDARGRLERAALELYAERGFELTTVAEIAERAGLTERTFFRHYADKREVLFGGQHVLQELFVGAVATAVGAPWLPVRQLPRSTPSRPDSTPWGRCSQAGMPTRVDVRPW